VSCCGSHCAATVQHFGEAAAESDLERYRRKGPDVTTRLLLESLLRRTSPDSTLLDIGGGIGVVSFELLSIGIRKATLVEASPSYLEKARAEARCQKSEDRLGVALGDFVALASELDVADFVVLDRVVCCYPDHVALLGKAAGLCRSVLALTYPRDRWWVRALIGIENLVRRFKGDDFRTFVHPAAALETSLRSAGFQRSNRRMTGIWCADTYAKAVAG
jgi:Methyltransferase domain